MIPKPNFKRFKKTAKQRGEVTPKVRALLQDRSNGICECCGVGGYLEAAHLTRRWKISQEGTTVNDLAHLCKSCHIHCDNTAEGRRWLENFAELLKLKE